MIITIDGPAGTGKSTVAKKLAELLGFAFFDTGAMYRAVTYKMLSQKISLGDQERIIKLLNEFVFRIETHENTRQYFVKNEEVTAQIRSEEVTKHVSEVSALAIVRGALVGIQRRFAQEGNAVFEGRDMGTVVFPQAELKVFLTASPEARAERRYKELLEKYPEDATKLTKEATLADLVRRDAYDSNRKESPLRQAEDAHLIDTTHLSAGEVVQVILSLKNKKQRSMTGEG